MSSDLYKTLLNEFAKVTGIQPEIPSDFESALRKLCGYLANKPLRAPSARRRWLLARINGKFRFNRDRIAAVYSHAAHHGVTFNYHAKCQIQDAFDLHDLASFETVLDASRCSPALRASLCALFEPIPDADTVAMFAAEVQEPTKLRKAKGDRPVDRDILLAALASFSFSVAEPEVLHAYFDRDYVAATYKESFWLQLRQRYPHLYNRDRALEILRVDGASAGSSDYRKVRDSLYSAIRESYQGLNNYGHLAIWLDPLTIGDRSVSWELAADAILFAEKHHEVRLRNMYFRHADVAQQTASHVPGLNLAAAAFEVANEGFTYKDTFACPPTDNTCVGGEALLLLFQKNQRDETLIPCPTCRSHDVEGNSYPTLGVRSWECRNLLCPDRSKYNRGKRYSFKALVMQEAIDDPRNEIPVASVRSWMRDVQVGRTIEDCVDMLIRHYSLHGDAVWLAGLDLPNKTRFGRRLICRPQVASAGSGGEDFFKSAWFLRYELGSRVPEAQEPGPASWEAPGVRVIHGEAERVLRLFPPATFDAAVTSPPYYNAREYSQWPNLYCYLHDMGIIARECYRVLRPDAPYFFNIFDYFDNDRTIVFSAMGNRRLPLSALTVDLFRRIGFTLLGNVTWDKGDIEGKRGFNGGNFSPYYQAPFNCWEHILLFWKPGASESNARKRIGRLRAVLAEPPVKKMVRGKNTLGHSAPFPEAIPGLLRSVLSPGSSVLDPFAGSATTARALAPQFHVTCIERHDEYCRLARQLQRRAAVGEERSQSSLFAGERT